MINSPTQRSDISGSSTRIFSTSTDLLEQRNLKPIVETHVNVDPTSAIPARKIQKPESVKNFERWTSKLKLKKLLLPDQQLLLESLKIKVLICWLVNYFTGNLGSTSVTQKQK